MSEYNKLKSKKLTLKLTNDYDYYVKWKTVCLNSLKVRQKLSKLGFLTGFYFLKSKIDYS